MNIKTKITKIHYDKQSKGILFDILKFASIFYWMGSSLRNTLYDKGFLKAHKVDAYVISVGNLTTGGVGKTPVVAEITKYLTEKGKKVAIVSRGYGGRLSNKKINLISDGEKTYYNASLAGDEPFWLAQNTNAVVITSKNRVKAAQYAIKEFGVTTIILDDGFQYRKLHRDMNIILSDSEKGFGNENLLPAGPLRETPESFKRVDRLVIVSKNINHERAEKIARIMGKKYNIKTLVCKTEPDCVYNIKTGEILKDGVKITALSGIGQPEQFYKFLNNFDIVETKTFDDHHKYTEDDIKNIHTPIVTTEKDAVKLVDFNFDNIYALKLKTSINVEDLLN